MMIRKQTATGTREWAAHSHNCMAGCQHNCSYCYARAQDKRGVGWTTETVLPPKVIGKKSGTIMFPTQHDITRTNVTICAPVILQMLEAGNNVLLVSKPRLDVISYLDGAGGLSNFKSQILWRFTIGSMDEATLAFWEPGAPTFKERLLALTYAAWHGYQTSVSMEPMLDTREDDIIALVETLLPHVTDCIWLGKMNHVEERLKINGLWNNYEVQAKALDLEASQTDERIWELFTRLKDNPKVKWKNSIKTVVGLELAKETGLDI